MARSVLGTAAQERPVGTHRDAQDAPPRLRDPHAVVDARQSDRQRPHPRRRRRAALLEAEDVSNGLRLLGVGVSGLADWVQDDLFASEDDDRRRRTRSRRGGRRRSPGPLVPRHGRAPRRSRRRLGLGRRARPGHGAVRDPLHPARPGAHVQRRRPRARCGAHRYVSRHDRCARPRHAETPTHRPQPPRRRLRRRLRVAARQGRPGDARLPRGRERPHRRGDGAPRAAAPADLRRDQGPHPRDRPLRAVRAATGGTTPAPSRASSTRSAAAARSTTPTTGPRRPRRRDRRSPASRSCSTPTSRPRGTTSSRSARSASATTATCWPGPSTPRATSATRSASRTCAPARCSPTRSPATSGGATWSAGATHLFYTTVDDAWRLTGSGATRSGTPTTTSLVLEEPDERYFVGVGRTQSEQYLVIGLSSKITSEVRVLEADDPEGDFRVVLPRRDGVEYSLEHAVIGGRRRLRHPAQRGRAQLRAGRRPGRRPDRPHGRSSPAATRRGSRTSTCSPASSSLSYRRDALSRIGIMLIDERTTASAPLAGDRRSARSCSPAASAPTPSGTSR